jgi:hypothetical protein
LKSVRRIDRREVADRFQFAQFVERCEDLSGSVRRWVEALCGRGGETNP